MDTNLVLFAALYEYQAKLAHHEKLAQHYWQIQPAEPGLLRRGAALMGHLLVHSGKALERLAQPVPRHVFEDKCA